MRRLELHERLVIVWVPTFLALLIFWLAAEAQQPGQQYADPLLPCVFCATVFTPPISLAWLVIEICVSGLRRCRRG